MLTVNDCCDILRHVTYKDNWRLKILSYWGMDYFQAAIVVPCSRGKTKIRPLLYTAPFPERDFKSPEDFVSWIFKEIVKFEKHEAREWLKVNNVRIYDPHRKKKLGVGHVSKAMFTQTDSR